MWNNYFLSLFPPPSRFLLILLRSVSFILRGLEVEKARMAANRRWRDRNYYAMLTLSNPTTSSWRRRLGWKPFPWNSKNINKVDPFFASRLVEQKALQSTRFVPILSGVFSCFILCPCRYDARNEKFSIHWKFILQQHSIVSETDK